MLKIFYSQGTEFSNPDALVALLDKETQARLQKKGTRAKFQSLVAHSLSLYAASALGRGELLPQRNVQGCPVFLYNGVPASNLYFSCAHTNNIVAVAVCEYAVGIDVESIAPWKKRISQRMFHPLERRLLEESAQSDIVFTRIWTLRESYGKMLGTGILGLPYASFLPSTEGVICSDTTCTLWTGFVKEFVLSAAWRKPLDSVSAPELIPVSLQDLESFLYIL